MALPAGRIMRGSHQQHEELLSPITSSALDRLRELIERAPLRETSSTEKVDTVGEDFREIRLILIDSAHRHSQIKREFWRLGGFEACIEVLQNLSLSTDLLSQPENIRGYVESLQGVLHALAEAVFQDAFNRDYFICQDKQIRWLEVQSSLARIISYDAVQEDQRVDIVSRLFSILFALSIREDDSSVVFQRHQDNADGREALTQAYAGQLTIHLWVPEVVHMIIQLWKCNVLGVDELFKASTSILSGLSRILCESSKYNLILANGTRITRLLLAALLLPNIHDTERKLLRRACTALLSLGLDSAEDAATLYQSALNNDFARDILLETLSSSTDPSQVYFDLSVCGHASVEVSSLGDQFPPEEPAKGYTFSCWIHIDAFDELCHTTIFGAFDESQTCFTLLYIERDTHHLVLQSSVTASKPSVRFRSRVFKVGVWYFITVVHLRPGSDKLGRALLFVDGKLTEKLQCHYPSRPALAPETPRRRRGKTSVGDRQRLGVQAFFGTPRDLSPRLGFGQLKSRWAMANAHLIADALPEELLLVFHSLGASYSGNYQDCLGSFQTYPASARLNLLNERLHPQDEDRSIIAYAIRGKAAKLVPERNILWHLSPLNFGSSDDSSNALTTEPHAQEVQAQRQDGLQMSATNQITHHAYSRSPIKIGGAKTRGVVRSAGSLTGAVIASVPKKLDDLGWQLSGCVPLALKILLVSDTPRGIETALSVAFGLVRNSWRNSEAFESQNGFALLASVLSSKISDILRRHDDANPAGLLRHVLLKNVLDFIGFDHANPFESIIVNPLAYRSLLIDSDIWRTGDHQTQCLYYNQFVAFVKDSKYRRFNVRRLLRMRASRKLIEALRIAPSHCSAVVPMLQAMKTCVQSSPSTEVYRTLALFITFATADAQRSKSATEPAHEDAQKFLSMQDLGSLTLKLLSEVLDEDSSGEQTKKFARTITIKWLLNLLAVEDPKIVALSVCLISRLLNSHPMSYVDSFADHSKGFDVLKKRLPQWWHVESLWTACFAIMFGAGKADDFGLNGPFDGIHLVESLKSTNKLSVRCPQMTAVLTEMLSEAVRSLMRSPELDHTSSPLENSDVPTESQASSVTSIKRLLSGVLSFVQAVHKTSENFRDFAACSEFVKDMLTVFYTPMIITSGGDMSTEEDNLANLFRMDEGSVLTVQQAQPQTEAPAYKKHLQESQPNKDQTRVKSGAQRRLSSFVMVYDPKRPSVLSEMSGVSRSTKSAYDMKPLSLLADILASVFTDQVLRRNDYTGLGLFLKAPPSPLALRAHLNSRLMSRTSILLEQQISSLPQCLREPRILINLARFLSQGYEALIEGWYEEGHVALIKLSAALLNLLRQHHIDGVKSVRLCSASLSEIREVLKGALIIQLCPSDFGMTITRPHELVQAAQVMKDCSVIIDERDDAYAARALFCALCLYLSRLSKQDYDDEVLNAADAGVLAAYAKQIYATSVDLKENEEMAVIVDFLTRFLDTSGANHVANDEFGELEKALGSCRDRLLAPYLERQRQIGAQALSARIGRRKERLESWQLQNVTLSHAWTEHQVSARHWMDNIHSSEYQRLVRSQKDRQEALEYLQTQAKEQVQSVNFFGPMIEGDRKLSWQLDGTEGRDRMRLRLSPLIDPDESGYEPKRARVLRRSTAHKASMGAKGVNVGRPAFLPADSKSTPPPNASEAIDDFEVVIDPSAGEEDDKNRRVLRSLEKGEEVRNVYNVARVVGLEACEGLLIVGRKCLYLIEGLIQRPDGEIINVWEAPMSERDLYAHIISGHEIDLQRSRERSTKDHTLHWRWTDVVSFSKRRFLTRPVALEVFFGDGLSLLLTASDEQQRNKLHAEILERNTDVGAKAPKDDKSLSWRSEMLKAPAEATSRFTNMFAPVFSNPITKRWSRGELSSFQYLMFINTMAGRTFNDITQYPIFSWILADYTSEELDLTNPRSYRDLTKPMGCQNIERAEAFKERYASFAEMDETTPAFHYGTHYSSAMIVTSYLIRLEPFVRSHVLLQAGSFDHADRLFGSIGRAWLSASKETPSDVRELIPEFFYLPDFLSNVNSYDFGHRENNEPVRDVALPRWAKGSPSIFIQKHREALESPYVSQNLHSWIDLVFGFKQRGEAALEATNVFHHLSYAGSKDLDTIQDQHERAATVGILHNFGLTPTQVFHRPHERREATGSQSSKLKKMLKSSQRLPAEIIDLSTPVNTIYGSRQLRAAGLYSILIPPTYVLRLEWHLQDQSVGFYDVESNQIRGRFEQLHQDDVLDAIATESGTLITASKDSTITAWTLKASANDIELHQIKSLFQHRAPVNVLAISEAFVTFLSASIDGTILLWDLNRLTLIREIKCPSAIDSAHFSTVTGHILVRLGNAIRVYTINGILLVEHQVYQPRDESLTSCAFYEPPGSDWVEHDIIFTGSGAGNIDVWAVIAGDDGHWKLDHWHRVQSAVSGLRSGESLNVTCIRALGQNLFAGYGSGKVFEFNAHK